jgi:hypothetical protein
MADSELQRVPMVSGLAYIERLRRLGSPVTVTLQPERENRYFPQAIAVLANEQKVGYVAPEVARRYHAALIMHGSPVTCPARRGSVSDRQGSGVELVLDFTSLPVEPAP